MDTYRQYQALNQRGDYAAAVPFAKKAEVAPENRTGV